MQQLNLKNGPTTLTLRHSIYDVGKLDSSQTNWKKRMTTCEEEGYQKHQLSMKSLPEIPESEYDTHLP